MGPGRITCCYPPWDFGKEIPHMGTLWVPRAREVPFRAVHSQRAEWPLSGGEAEGAFLWELARKTGEPAHPSMGPLDAIGA